jgi:hypothetical protein
MLLGIVFTAVDRLGFTARLAPAQLGCRLGHTSLWLWAVHSAVVSLRAFGHACSRHSMLRSLTLRFYLWCTSHHLTSIFVVVLSCTCRDFLLPCSAWEKMSDSSDRSHTSSTPVIATLPMAFTLSPSSLPSYSSGDDINLNITLVDLYGAPCNVLPNSRSTDVVTLRVADPRAAGQNLANIGGGNPSRIAGLKYVCSALDRVKCSDTCAPGTMCRAFPRAQPLVMLELNVT